MTTAPRHLVSTRARLAAVPAAIAALAAARLRTGDVVMAHASTPSATPGIGTPGIGTPAAVTTPWREMAEGMWSTIQSTFYVPEAGLYLAKTPREENHISELWPFSALFSGLNARASAGVAPSADADLDAAFALLAEYADPRADPPGYDSYPIRLNGGDKYYDDNEWLGIDGVYAWRHLKDQRYLDLATTTWAFALSGWSDDMGGGIYWKQYDASTKNTCSNAPAAVLAMLLHEETGNEDYRAWAQRILDWTAQLKGPNNGVYFDHLNDDGTIDRATYTYNTGTPIHANALLYRATGDERYLTEARALAQASLDWFAPAASAVDSIRFFPNTPWFNVILFRGYVALAEVSPAPAADGVYLRAMLDSLQFGWSNARDENGLLNPDWSGRAAVTDNWKLLDQAPILEFASTAIRLGL